MVIMKKICYFIAAISLVGIMISGCARSPGQGSPAAKSSSPLSASSQENSISTGVVVPLTISAPADGATLTDTSVTVNGQTSAGALIKVNDEADIADAQGHFSIPLNLDDGTNYIDVVSTDENGNEGEVLLSVEVDQNPDLTAEISSIAPLDSLPLTVSEPKDNSTVTAGQVTVKGQTSPQAIVSVDDQADIAGDDGSFSIAVNLEEGPNLVDIIASNDNGDEVEVLLVVNAVSGM
jgi:hypothetical protein